MAKRHPDEKPNRAYTIDELAAMQGVDGPQDIEYIASLWPGEGDGDAVLNFILEERQQRRALHKKQ